jgi:phosphatidylinositol glycan class B
VTLFDHVTSQALFYARPVSYLQSVFPNPPVPLHRAVDVNLMPAQPSHVVLFGQLLELSEDTSDDKQVSVRQALTERGYAETWNGWNGFDFAQDEIERRGGVRVWSLTTG